MNTRHALIGTVALALVAGSAAAIAEPGPAGPAERGNAMWDHHRGFGDDGRAGLGAGAWGEEGPGPMVERRLARILAIQETELGIRSDQLDAWRDYTDALQAMLASPQDRPADVDPGKPFARSEAMAAAAIERGKAGEKLRAAVDGLKKALTPEQLARVERRGRGDGAADRGWRRQHPWADMEGDERDGPQADRHDRRERRADRDDDARGDPLEPEADRHDRGDRSRDGSGSDEDGRL